MRRRRPCHANNSAAADKSFVAPLATKSGKLLPAAGGSNTFIAARTHGQHAFYCYDCCGGAMIYQSLFICCSEIDMLASQHYTLSNQE
jgi:hypothetical protein